MSVTVNGGTTQEQAVITAAHSAAAAAVAQAKTGAAAGSNSFQTWFGPSTIASNAAAAAVYSGAVTAFSANNFIYDLTVSVPVTVFFELPVTLQSLVTNTATFVLWDETWLAYDAGDLQYLIGSSIIHEMCLTFGGNNLQDPAGVSNEETAMALALYNPLSAQLSPLNYMYYAAAFLPAP